MQSMSSFINKDVSFIPTTCEEYMCTQYNFMCIKFVSDLGLASLWFSSSNPFSSTKKKLHELTRIRSHLSALLYCYTSTYPFIVTSLL